MTIRLSEHFTLDEFIISETAERNGIDNNPSQEIILNLTKTASMLESIRARLDLHPIKITSGYRCVALNSLIGGAPDSAHMQGYAADFICPEFGSPRDICKEIEHAVFYDQLIFEFSWVHIAFAPAMRRMVLTKNGTGYITGIA